MLDLLTLIEWIVFLGIFLILISYLVWNMRIILGQQYFQDGEKLSTYECGFLPFSSARVQFDIKYFIVALLFLLFDLEIAWIFPFALNVGAFGYYGTMIMIKFLLLLFLGLCFEISSNVLNWANNITNISFVPIFFLTSQTPKGTPEIDLNSFFEQLSTKPLYVYSVVLLLFFIYITVQQNSSLNVYSNTLLVLYLILLLEFWKILSLLIEDLDLLNLKYQNGWFTTDSVNLFFLGVLIKFAFAILVVFMLCFFQKQIGIFFQGTILCLLFAPISNELILILLAVETANICIYGIFLTPQRLTLKNFKRIEACFKYFCLSSIFAGSFLGMVLFSLILFNNTALTQIHAQLNETTLFLKKQHFLSIVVFFTFFITFVFFKLAVFPNHWWAPDIYEGSSLIIFGIFAICIKLAIFGIFYQLIYFIFYDWLFVFFSWLLIGCLGSIIFGAIGAINQKNIKRFLAYSSMHHMGFVFLCMVSTLIVSANSSIFYFFSYIITLLVFYLTYCIINKLDSFRSIIYISELTTIRFLKTPFFAIILVFSICSMGGFPPLIGFFGKYFVFNDLLLATHITLFFVAVITSSISAYNYLRLINILLFRRNTTNLYTFWFIKLFKKDIELYKDTTIFFLKIQLIFNFLKSNLNKLMCIVLIMGCAVLLFPSQDWIIFKNCFLSN